MHYIHIFKETGEKANTLTITIEKISLHVAHFTWWTISPLIRLSLTLHSGESGVFCWTPQFVSSVCFSVKKQQQFLLSCTGKMFYSLTLKIILRDITKHFIFYMLNNKKNPVHLGGLTLQNCELSLLHIYPCRFLYSQWVGSETHFKSCTLQGQRHQMDNG